MKISIKELCACDQRTYPADIAFYRVDGNVFLKGIKDVTGDVIFYRDSSDRLVIDYQLQGYFICPDAYTLEDVEVHFDLSDSQIVCFSQNEEGYYLKDAQELEELILDICLPEVPIKVEKSGKTSYYSGDGWSCMSEEDYLNSQKDKIDPRWEKLMEYKED